MKYQVHALVGAGHKTTNGVFNHRTTRGMIRLYYVIHGSADVTLGDSVHHLQAGHIYMFRQCGKTQPITTHHFDHIFFDFHILYSTLNTELVDIPCDSDILFDTFHNIRPYVNDRKSNITLLTHFLEMILCRIDEIYHLPVVQNLLVQHAMEIINTRSTTITAEELARQLNLNVCYFTRLFHGEVGMPPMQYIRICRLLQGIEFIRSGMNVGEAALACGYTSPAAFSNAVKKHFRCTPTQFQ